jgi:hypothetical protein
MLDKYKEYSGSLYKHKKVNVTISDGRSFIRDCDAKYDIIMASLIDTWAASSAGAYNLSENNIYTVEAFVDYYKHLTDDGIISFQRFDSESLRLFSVVEEMAKIVGIEDVSQHVVVTGYKHYDNFMFSKKPWTAEEITKLSQWCQERKFWISYDRFNIRDNKFHNYFSKDPKIRAAAIRDYPRDISPVTDDRPFFFQSEKAYEFKHFLVKLLKQNKLLSGELLFKKGISSLQYAIIVLSLLIFVLILLPLVLLKKNQLRKQMGAKLYTLLYFIFIGIGFIMIEVAFMQKFILFLGHPVYSFAVVLFTLLIFGGLGSRFTKRWDEADIKKVLPKVLGILLVISVIYMLLLSGVFYALIFLPVFIRILITVILLAPLAFVMGMPMPLGIKYINRRFSSLIPWAWALNGGFSVLGSCVAVYLAIRFGFSRVLLTGTFLYLATLILTVGFKSFKETKA